MYFLSHFLGIMFTLAIVFKVLTSCKNFTDWLRSIDHSRSYSYEREPALFSPSERSFLGVLEQALGPEYRVFAKVGVADLLRPENGVGRQAALNRITGKHVDFVVCNAEDLSIVGVIQLDDNSHLPYSRRNRDAFVDSAFASAGLPILRYPASADCTLSSVREAIEQGLDITVEGPGVAPPKRFISPKVAYLCDFKPSRRESPTAKR